MSGGTKTAEGDWSAMLPDLEAALERARGLGAASAKIACRRVERTPVEFEAGRLKHAGAAEEFGFTLDVLMDGRRGQSSGQGPEDLARAVERAVALARIGSVAHFAAWPAPAPATPVTGWSERTQALTRETLIEACQTLTDRLLAADGQLHVTASAERQAGTGILVTTGGLRHVWQRTGWSLGAMVQRTRGTDMLFAHDGRRWGDVNAFFDPAAVADKIAEQLRHAEREAAALTGPVKVFLPPDVLHAFLTPLWLGINGRTVAKGESPLAGKIGQPVLAPAFSIVDDPHRPYGRGTCDRDEDGIPTRQQTIVRAGVLEGFLYDLDSAALAGAEPTGHTACQPHYPVVTPGRRLSTELLAGMDEGLYLTSNLIGFGQSNMVNGDFACNVGLGYRIRNGEIVGRVKNTMIAGNLYRILGGNVELSADTDHEGVMPFAVVEGVTASAGR